MGNFDFLKNEYPELAKLAQLAENYYAFDPASTIGKLRTFCEFVVKDIYTQQTTIPLGICVTLTAESVVFTHWPPFPEALKTSILTSFISMLTSTLSASGNTATVAVEVCILPPDSVDGTLCTL